MSTAALAETVGHGHEHHEPNFFFKYIWSTDHKTIGKQFMFSGLLFFLVGGLLALAVRWHLAWPHSPVPILGEVQGKDYNQLFTMHASIMIFLVIIPMLGGAFGNFVIPLQIGARDMAFPWLNAAAYWLMWPAIMLLVSSFFVPGGPAQSGWTSYAPLSLLSDGSAQTSNVWTIFNGQNLWLIGVMIVGFSSVFGSLNYIVTIIKMRAPGMTLFACR